MITLLRWPYFGFRRKAIAEVRGGPLAPSLRGQVCFIAVEGGTKVVADISGLPPYRAGQGDQDPIGPHGFHVHQNGNCEVGDPENPFQAAGGHYNPTKEPHGNHAGDLPNLFSNRGRAIMSVFTDRFRVEDVVGRSVIIHQNPDDFRSQPAGDAGKRLACGVIRWV